MSESSPAPLDDDELQLIARHLAEDQSRIQRFYTARGRLLWIKRVETLSLLERLQKGDPMKAFRKERAAIAGLAALGQPVPTILQDGPGYMVMADAGSSLFNRLSQEVLGEEEAVRAFEEVGRVLGRLHALGYAHGRPVIRDFCWSGSKITMIDLERFELRKRRHRTLALDLVIFAQGWFARTGVVDNDAKLLDAAFAAYREEAPTGPWQAINKWARIIRPFRGFLTLLLRLRPGWREVQGAVWTLDYLAKQAPTEGHDTGLA